MTKRKIGKWEIGKAQGAEKEKKNKKLFRVDEYEGKGLKMVMFITIII